MKLVLVRVVADPKWQKIVPSKPVSICGGLERSGDHRVNPWAKNILVPIWFKKKLAQIWAKVSVAKLCGSRIRTPDHPLVGY